MANLYAYAIIKPKNQKTHYLVYTHGDRPCFELVSEDKNQGEKMIIPSKDTFIDDMFFMIYTFIFKKYPDNDFSGNQIKEIITDEKERRSLYQKIQEFLKNQDIDIDFYISEDSSIFDQISDIKHYSNNYKVFITSSHEDFCRFYNKVIVKILNFQRNKK